MSQLVHRKVGSLFLCVGLLNLLFWHLYTTAYDRGSFPVAGAIYGYSAKSLWLMLNIVPNLLLIVGLYILLSEISQLNLLTRIGQFGTNLGIVLVGFSTAFFTFFDMMGSPTPSRLFYSISGAGLLFIAIGQWNSHNISKRACVLLFAIGIAGLIAGLSMLSDTRSWGNIRSYDQAFGTLAYVLSGFAWILIGLDFLLDRQ